MFMVSKLTQGRQTELLLFMHDQNKDFLMVLHIPNNRFSKQNTEMVISTYFT